MNRQKALKIVKSLMAAYLVTAVLLCITAFVLWKWNLSEMIINTVMIVIYILSAAVGGFYLGKKQREKKFLWGLLLGFLYIALLLFMSAAVNGPAGLISKNTLTMAFICILSGMLGGMLA